jgi:AcrR family transcriptional regulator
MARAGLDRATVTQAAARIADADGLDAVSFARIAADLGVKPPSLYNHVDGMTALLDELTLLAIGELLEQSRDAIMGRSGWNALAALAHAQRAYAAEHPGRYTATLRSLHGRGHAGEKIAEAYLAVMLAALRGLGLHGDDALHAVRSLRAAVSGFIELELRGGFGMNLDVDESFARLLRVLEIGTVGWAQPTVATHQANKS